MTVIAQDALIDGVAPTLTRSRTWYGPSGAQVTGDSVARHVEAAARLMDREQWDPQLYAPLSGHHIYDALASTRLDGAGDEDTQRVAATVMQALLRAHTGAPYVNYESWSEHRERTLPEVLALLRLTAESARRYGPGIVQTPQLVPGDI